MDRTCENCIHKDKTDQDFPCCFCGGGNPEWEGIVEYEKEVKKHEKS